MNQTYTTPTTEATGNVTTAPTFTPPDTKRKRESHANQSNQKKATERVENFIFLKK